jgi:hypothetical protein
VDEDEPRVFRGLTKLESAQEDLRRAFASDGGFVLPGVREQRARAALVSFRSALDWLEDTPHFERVISSGLTACSTKQAARSGKASVAA